MDIIATKPVTAVAVPSMVYDKWYMTQLSGKFDATNGKTIVQLQRANKTGNVWTLMPNDTHGSEITFSLDVFKEMATTPELATAFAAVLEAVTVYATKKNLL